MGADNNETNPSTTETTSSNSPPHSTSSRVFTWLVNLVASFTAAVLSHPSVQQAAASVVVMGMNNFLRQEDLDVHLETMEATLARKQKGIVRKAGEEFPSLFRTFIKGAMGRPESTVMSKEDADACLEEIEKTMSVEELEDDDTMNTRQPAFSFLRAHHPHSD